MKFDEAVRRPQRDEPTRDFRQIDVWRLEWARVEPNALDATRTPFLPSPIAIRGAPGLAGPPA